MALLPTCIASHETISCVADVQVVETIGFEDDDDDTLPAPQDLPSDPAEKQADTEASSDKPSGTSQDEVARPQGPAPPPQGPALPAVPPPSDGDADDEKMPEEEVAGPQLAPVPERLIRKDYVSQVGTKQPGSVHLALDPLTGQQVIFLIHARQLVHVHIWCTTSDPAACPFCKACLHGS